MIDEGQIRLWWSIFRPDNALEEIRLLGAGTVSGYFTDVDTLIRELQQYANHPKFSIYFIINEIKKGCQYRIQEDRLVRVSEGETTDENDISSRKWLLIDIDPHRYVDGEEVKGINSSDEELAEARNTARNVYDYLKGMGFSEPVTAMSGNGIHIYYRIDEPNDKETTNLIKTFLLSLSQKFSTTKADVDEAVFTKARLSKLFGTTPHKGADTKERPCRLAVIEYVPKEIKVVSRELIQRVADEYDDPKKREAELRQQRRQNGQAQYSSEIPDVSLQDFLDKHGIEYSGPVYDSARGAMKFTLDHCPWCDEHTTKDGTKDAVLWEWPSGQKDFNCFHGHCANRGWTEFWQLFDPNLYKDAWREQRQQGQTFSALPPATQQPQPTQSVQSENAAYKEGVLEENQEYGKKWFFTSDVEMFDPSKAVSIKTGFEGIDSTMHGMNLGEVTLLTGGNGAGKSSWLNSLILNVVDQGYKTALWSRELPASMEVYWLSYVAAGKRYLKESTYGSGKWYIPKQIKEKIDQWLYGKFFLYNNYYPAKWKQLETDLMIPIEGGCKLIILDNLFSLNISDFGKDKYDNQTELIVSLCALAKKYGIHILLVAHPRKLTGYIRKVDISGTADLTNAVDNVWILHRNNLDFQKAYDDFYKGAEAKKSSYIRAAEKFAGVDTVFEIAKNRFFGVVDRTFGMHYDTVSRRFMNTLDEVRQYGWEDNPVQAQINFQQESMPFPEPTEEDNPF